MRLATAEGLEAHRRSIAMRLGPNALSGSGEEDA
jgi:hypothetical protein